MAASTATYMGLRTYRYTPPTTRRSGAATGAGVPRPSTTKRTNAPTSTISPATSSAAPNARTGIQYGRGSRACQPPVNNHGIAPATTPGANRKKSALPSAAVGLRMAMPHFPVHRGIRVSYSRPCNGSRTAMWSREGRGLAPEEYEGGNRAARGPLGTGWGLVGAFCCYVLLDAHPAVSSI